VCGACQQLWPDPMACETSTSVLAALLSKQLLSTSPASRARKHRSPSSTSKFLKHRLGNDHLHSDKRYTMPKTVFFTTITPLPAGITRKSVFDMYHDHLAMIDLNPLVVERFMCKPPRYAPTDEYWSMWYTIKGMFPDSCLATRTILTATRQSVLSSRRPRNWLCLLPCLLPRHTRGSPNTRIRTSRS
jgi:hypothetical protein